jgi:hypothetical protein
MVKRFLCAFLTFAFVLTAGTAVSHAAAYPLVVPDKTNVMTGEAVSFKITTSTRVKKIQSVIDGEGGRSYTSFTAGQDVRNWNVKLTFTKDGSRKVQFKCTMTSGETVLIPKKPVTIKVTFKYTAESTSKAITKGKTVTFTLKTPSAIKSVYALVDGAKQKIIVSKSDSEKDGIKIWKLNVTFFKLGERSVRFDACIDNKVKKTFPDKGITIIVKESI